MTKTVKLAMFTVMIFSMILPVSAGSDTMMASAQTQDDSQRLAQKMNDIDRNFAEYLKAQQAALDAELQVREIDQKISTQKGLGEAADTSLLVAQKAALEAKLKALLQKIDMLQEQSYLLHEIPEAKMQKLEHFKGQAVRHYAASDRLDTVFIDAAEESVQVILSASEDPAMSDPADRKRSPRSTGDDFQSLAAQYGIPVEIKQFVQSSSHNSATYLTDSIRDCTGTTKNSDCGPLAGGVEICVRQTTNDCVRATLGFPATRNGVSGFVTVAHPFAIPHGTSGKITDPAEAFKNNVFQVGPAIKVTADTKRTSSAFDASYGDRLVGTLVHAEYGGSPKKDSAFVQLQPGARTLPQEIVSSGTTNFAISGYSEADSDKKAGTYVTKSGMKTGVTSGMIRSSDARQVYATYNECKGDSGSPVGILKGSSFKVTGMHLGKNPNPSYSIQSCGDNYDGYSRYIQYTIIKSDLGLR